MIFLKKTIDINCIICYSTVSTDNTSRKGVIRVYRLDYTSGKPIYEQIRDNLKKLIIDGVLKPDDKILSVRELAVEMTINPNTIQKAYKDLESEGYIYSVRAKGYFVAPKNNIKNTENLFKSFKETVSELYYLGVEEKELLSMIFEIYKNNDDETGGKADD